MINNLRPMAIFATVVNEGSFRAAAKKLGLSPSRISETVSELEVQLGVTLLFRSTRRLSLTNEGKILFKRANAMIESAEFGLNEITPLSKQPVGALRLSLPAFLPGTDLFTALAAFTKKYPGVALSMSFSDHRVNLIEQGFDLAIRVGRLESSNLMSRKLKDFERWLVASPDYMMRHPTPKHPIELEGWDWIGFEHRPDTRNFTGKNGQSITVTGKSQIVVDSAEALLKLAVAGVGITELPADRIKLEIDNGQLVRLLPAWKLKIIPCYAVWPGKSRRENLTLLLVDCLAKYANR